MGNAESKNPIPHSPFRIASKLSLDKPFSFSQVTEDPIMIPGFRFDSPVVATGCATTPPTRFNSLRPPDSGDPFRCPLGARTLFPRNRTLVNQQGRGPRNTRAGKRVFVGSRT